MDDYVEDDACVKVAGLPPSHAAKCAVSLSVWGNENSLRFSGVASFAFGILQGG